LQNFALKAQGIKAFSIIFEASTPNHGNLVLPNLNIFLKKNLPELFQALSNPSKARF
jgi:hypothetical protein